MVSGSFRLGLCLAALWVAQGGACDRPRKVPPPAPRAARPAVAPPQWNPAGYCRDTCPRLVRCRLGQVDARVFSQEVERCRLDCLRRIRDHLDEAVAAAPCYARQECGPLTACLSEVRRIVADARIPAKGKECRELCERLGTCQGDATDCRLRCQTGDVAIYRALLRCGGQRCPKLRGCVEQLLQVR